MRTPKEVYDRLLWSTHEYDLNQVVIGYKDRFTGMQTIRFNDFIDLGDENDSLCIPWHRIWYFAIINGDGTETMLWDRENRFDIFLTDI